jgi:tRNA (cmo5U34)-methyltransferase
MRIRADEKKHIADLRAWLEETRDVPLEEMSDFFSARVAGYEAHMSTWAQAYARMAQLVPETCRTLLDVGCGTGLELDEIYARFPDMQVTGVDLCPAMLEVLAQKHGAHAPRLLCADYFQANLGEATFDAAVSFETLHHVTAQKKRTVFEKIVRALRSGGVYIQADYIACCEEEETMLFEECARRRARDHIEPERFIHFDTPLTLEHELQAMLDAGFARARALEAIEGATLILAEK